MMIWQIHKFIRRSGATVCRVIALIVWTMASALASDTSVHDAGAFTSVNTTQADCLFNWAESTYASAFAPRGSLSLSAAPYHYRRYAQTNSYLGVSSSDNHVYYLGPLSAFSVQDMGGALTWSAKAKCVTVEEALGLLGIAVVDDVDRQSSAAARGYLSVLTIQARAMALELAQGGGMAGAMLDSITPPISLPPDGSGVEKRITMSMLLASYVKNAQSPGGEIARGIMGDVDPARYGEYRYPMLVLYAFMQEVGVPLLAEIEMANPSPRAATARVASVDPCAAIDGFLNDLPATVTGAVNSANSSGSGIFSTIWNGAVSGAAIVAGVTAGAATTVARGIIHHIPGVDAIRAGMDVGHAVTDLKSMLEQWTAVLTPATTLHKSPGTPNQGSFTVVMSNGGQQTNWPPSVTSCASLLGVQLPRLNSADGAGVVWNPGAGFGDLALADDSDSVIANNQAGFRFHSATETDALHNNAKAVVKQGDATLEVTVSMPGMQNLVAALAPSLGGVTATVADLASKPASQAFGKTVSGTATIEYHKLTSARIEYRSAQEQLNAASEDGTDPNGQWSGSLTVTLSGMCSNQSVTRPISWRFSNGVAQLSVSFPIAGVPMMTESCSFNINETLRLESLDGRSYIVTAGTHDNVIDPVDYPGYPQPPYTISGIRDERYLVIED